MPSEEQMRTAMQAYVDGFENADLEALVNLYAEEATVEDPVGGEIRQGKEAIRDFYATALQTGAKLKLSAPIRASHGNAAAMAFEVHLNYQGADMVIHAIDVMTFNEAGEFTSMKAYWGPGDMQMA